MMKKRFLMLTMVLLGLFAGVNAIFADEELTPEQAETYGYWARLTAKPASNTGGSGKVCVRNDYADPEASEYDAVSSSADNYTAIFVLTSANIDATFNVYYEPNPGSYFTGWSFTEGGTDLGKEERTGVGVSPSSTRGHSNIREYTIYGVFEPVRIVSYEFVGGTNTTSHDGENWTCTQTVRFRAETPGASALGTLGDQNHFKAPTLTPKAGTSGTWTTSVDAWRPTNPNQNIALYGDYAELTVPVTFTAPNGNPGEYGATLTLETYAGVKMNVHLSARTVVPGAEAIRYNKSKEHQETGGLATLLANAEADDIIKLNGDYSSAVSINKNITFDLNGYALSNTLTVSGGNVTLAYSPYGGSASNMIVSGGKAVLNGGTIGLLTIRPGATVEQNGATITGGINNNGTLATTDGTVNGALTSSGTLTLNGGTFTNNSSEAILVTGGTAIISRGTITGQTYGVKTTGGSTTIEKLAAITGGTKALYGNGGSLIVNNGKFTDPSELIAGTVTFNAGYFQTATGPTALGKQVWRNTAGAEFREGYAYFVGDQAAAQASNVSVCRIGQAAYASLEEALAYANNTPDKQALIFMENDYVLPAGYYTIPRNATLVVPMENNQQIAYPLVKHASAYSSYPAPYAFRTLTLESGVNLNVLGTIELTCAQYYRTGDAEQSIPCGPYGHLVLKPGSHITLNNGGELRAWGYVTGDGTRDANGTYLSGEIDARRGSIVREQFQIGDWKGGDVSFTMILDQTPQDKTGLFPIYEYFIQNVESPVKYHPGSALYCAAGVDVSGLTAYANEIKVVGVEGEAAMFLMDEMADAENTWVRKWYDVQHDKQVYEVNSGAQLGSMVIDLGEVPKALIDPGEPGMYKITMDSRKFILPLTSNMKIHLLSGYMQFTQSTVCLPGMEVEVDKESTISITNMERDGVVEGALYFYDSDQWGRYVQSGKYGTIVHYSATLGEKPTVRSVSSAEAIGDAILNVHGTFQVGEKCAVYTTVGKTEIESGVWVANPAVGGASIISTNEDAGTFIFGDDAPAALGVTVENGTFAFNAQGELNPDVLVNYDNSSNGIVINPTARGNSAHIYGFELCTSAMLKNADGTFAQTYTDNEHHAVAGKSYCYMNDHWTTMEVAEKGECFMKDNYGTFYAKPAEYVAVVATVVAGNVVGNDDHTFSDAAGAGRLFILMSDDCQWWEVEKKDNLYHCIHPNNDTYYYWDETEGKWMEQRFRITWKNWDGTEIKSYTYNPGTGEPREVEYSVTYGTMAEYLGSNPTREANIDYTYDFTGWIPELGPVTQDVTYTATYQEKPRKYTIIFQNEGGVEIERQFLTHNEVPVCENVPTRTGFILQWSPAIAAVTGNATYTATWLEEPPTEYQVTFFDYDGETILQQGNVAVGSMPTPPADPTGKPETSEYTYVFDHWSPTPEIVSATSVKSYTAVYHEVAKTYTVIFQNEDGSEIERHEYTYGETPVCSATPTKDNTAEWTFGFAWTPQIQTVMGSATYRATFPATKNKYTVTLRSNNESVCSFTGAGIYDYGTEITIGVVLNSDDYEFLGWEEDESLAQSFTTTVTGDITLMAKIGSAEVTMDMTLGINQHPVVPDGMTINIRNLTLISEGDESAQLSGHVENLKIWGDAIFWLDKEFDARIWYAVAVPWTVDVAHGIYSVDEYGEPAARQIVANTFDIIALNSAANAAGASSKDCWNYVDEMDGLLHPGKAYLIYLTEDQPDGLMFFKKSREPISNTTTNVITTGGDGARDNWNAIANPALYYAEMETGATIGQKYDGKTDGYEPFDIDGYEWIVGEPFFIQATTPKTVVAEELGGGGLLPAPAYHAPKAENDITDMRCTVELTQNGKLADRLFVATTEEKSDAYIIGQDVAKMGVSNKVAQMWVNRYDAKLCMNTIEPMDSRAEYPLSISAPAAGEYTISCQLSAVSDQYALYLTLDGNAIWDLSDGAYVLNLNKGTVSNYGLRISARAPQVVTGVDEAIVDAQGDTRKVLINNQVFIIRGDKVYTIDGQMVK